MSGTTLTRRDTSAREGDGLRRLAAVLAGVAVAEAIGILLFAGMGDRRFPVGVDFVTAGFLSSIVLFPIVGALIVQRRPPSRVAWLMLVIGLGFGIGLLMYGYGTVGMPPARPLPGALQFLVFSQVFFVPVPATAVAWLLLLFPDDRFHAPRWRLVALAAILGAVANAAGTLFQRGLVDTQRFPSVLNPLGAPEWLAPAADLAVNAGNAIVTGAVLLGAVSLALRYRQADPVEAAQIRWIALVAAIAAPAFAIAALQIEPVSDVAFGLGLCVLACMPIAIGIAITRYRLYEIDRLINRALVYGSLTAILAGVFTAAVGLAQRMFVSVTGQSSDAAIVLTTLVVATLYAPLRKRLEAIVDQRFKYDEHRFGAYREEVLRVLNVIEPGRAAERLATEAVRELAASGAAVVDADDKALATAGQWPVAAVVRLPIPGAPKGLVAILVGPRFDGRAHDPRSIAELQEVASLISAAIRLHGAPAR
jgi:hypothetical protein